MINLNNILEKLCDSEVEFVIVEGFAAVVHGSSMLTQDLDVCTVLSSSTIEKLRVAFRDLHPVHRFIPQRLSFLEHPEPGTPIKNLYLQTDLGQVDFLVILTG